MTGFAPRAVLRFLCLPQRAQYQILQLAIDSMAPRRKNRTNPFSLLRVSSNATKREICEAFDARLLLWTNQFRQDIRDAEIQFQHIQEFFEANGLWKKADIPSRAMDELPGKIVRSFDELVAALKAALSLQEKPFEEPSPALTANTAAAQRRASQAIGSLLEQLAVVDGSLAESDRTAFTLNYANIHESRGCGTRNTDCYICIEKFQDDTPTFTHDDGSCKVTFCKGCLDRWVESKVDDGALPTCPNCRVTLERLANCTAWV